MAPTLGPLPLARASLLALRGGASQEMNAAAAAGLLASTASLTKNILGIGVLTIAAGMAAGTGVGPATLAIGGFHVMAAYTFILLGELCGSTGLGATCSFEGLWASTLGESTSWLVSASIGALTFSVCTVYLICLGELLPPLLAVLRAPTALRSRRAGILLAASLVLPACLPKSLAGLSAVSLLGVGALVYTAIFSLLRWADGAYSHDGAQNKGGTTTQLSFYQSMPEALRPDFASVQPWRVSGQTAVLIANLGVALCAHFNAPGFYRSLESASPARFATMGYSAFAAVFFLTLCIALPGYFTFGANSQPLILTNYHPTDDAAATCARLATAASLCCSFPLVFAALREAVLAVGARGLSEAAMAAFVVPGGRCWWTATLALPTLAVAIALVVDDLGLVVGLLGSVLGGGIMYVAPAAMHAAQLLKRGEQGGGGRRALLLAVDAAIAAYGVLGQMVMGTVVTWRNARATSSTSS